MPTIATADDTQLHYEFDDSAGERPAVVFLNGMTQSTQHWSTQVDLFSEDFRVLTYDARGQGKSELGDLAPTMDRHTDDLARLLDHLDLERAHVVGFSHGARIALGFAADKPGRLSRLVLTSATAEPTAMARTIVRSWREILEAGGLEAMTWAALPAILGDAYLEQHESIIDGIVRAALRRNSERGVRALLEAMEDYPDLDSLAGRIEAPTLVVSASEDLLVDGDGAEKLAELTGGRHCEITGVGHTIPIEAPQEFHARVSQFLTSDRR